MASQDEKGRFSDVAQGAQGASTRAHAATAKATQSGEPADHITAEAAHKQAAEAHSKAALKAESGGLRHKHTTAMNAHLSQAKAHAAEANKAKPKSKPMYPIKEKATATAPTY